ncbi:MAG: cell wall-binding repeat-containing protein, partial [Nakamurella sp.]
LGGPDRVSQKVKGQLTALGVRNIVTIAGQDRFETSALLGTLARLGTDVGGLGQDGSLAAIANGLTGFADALAAGPYLARSGGTLLLSPPARLPDSLRKFLAAHHQTLTSVLALGGPSTISEKVLVAGLAAK